MPYSRDSVVRRVTQYYELLEKLAYIDDSEIARPPPTGWTDEQLHVEMLMAAERSGKVVDLVRHLPYLRCDRELEVYAPCRIVSYLREDMSYEASTPEMAKDFFHKRIMVCGEDGIVCPKGMIALASDLRIDAILLDTDEGVVYHCDGSMQDPDAPGNEPWRQGGKQYQAEEFLDMIYDQVNSLLIIPIPEPFPWFEGGLTPEGAVSPQKGWPFNVGDLLTFVYSVSNKYWLKMVGKRACARTHISMPSENTERPDERKMMIRQSTTTMTIFNSESY